MKTAYLRMQKIPMQRIMREIVKAIRQITMIDMSETGNQH